MMGSRCRMGLLALIIAALCTGCGQQATEEVKRDFKAEAEAVYVSGVSADDCFLCSGMSEYEGQNNVGINVIITDKTASPPLADRSIIPSKRTSHGAARFPVRKCVSLIWTKPQKFKRSC